MIRYVVEIAQYFYNAFWKIVKTWLRIDGGYKGKKGWPNVAESTRSQIQTEI